MAHEAQDSLSRGYIPEADAFVGTACGRKAAVWGKSHGSYHGRMAKKVAQLSPCRDIPQACYAVRTVPGSVAGDQKILVPSAANSPDSFAPGRVAVSREEGSAVGREGNSIHSPSMLRNRANLSPRSDIPKA